MYRSLTQLARERISLVVNEGDHVLDGTVGNGQDTRHLATLVGSSGRVVGYDIQEAALMATRARLLEEGLMDRVSLRHESHARMIDLLPWNRHRFSAVMFNLGYLPGSDHTVRTTSRSTLAALEAALELVSPGGVISVVAYPGHEGGQEEAAVVEAWARAAVSRGFDIEMHTVNDTKSTAPILFLVRCGRS